MALYKREFGVGFNLGFYSEVWSRLMGMLMSDAELIVVFNISSTDFGNKA